MLHCAVDNRSQILATIQKKKMQHLKCIFTKIKNNVKFQPW